MIKGNDIFYILKRRVFGAKISNFRTCLPLKVKLCRSCSKNVTTKQHCYELPCRNQKGVTSIVRAVHRIRRSYASRIALWYSRFKTLISDFPLYMLFTLSRVTVTKHGAPLVIGFIGSSPIVTTNNYYTTADLHNLQSLNTNLLRLFTLVFTNRFLATYL
jgi:hypothetical protein